MARSRSLLVSSLYFLILIFNCVYFHSQISLIGPVVLGWCFIVDVSCQEITLVSSLLATNRTYVCPDEIVTYVCSGGGNEIDLYAPPHISLSNSLSYARGDTEGSGLGVGPILTVLFSTAEPLMIANILVQNASLPEFSIHCAVRSPIQETETQHRPSGNCL